MKKDLIEIRFESVLLNSLTREAENLGSFEQANNFRYDFPTLNSKL